MVRRVQILKQPQQTVEVAKILSLLVPLLFSSFVMSGVNQLLVDHVKGVPCWGTDVCVDIVNHIHDATRHYSVLISIKAAVVFYIY